FYLFQTDIKQALEASVKDYLFDDQATEDMNDLIKMQKSEIQSTQHEYILKQMAVQLESIVEITLKDSYQAEIVDIAYTFNQPTDYAYEDMEEVIVYLRELEDDEGRIDAVDGVVSSRDEQRSVEDDDNK